MRLTTIALSGLLAALAPAGLTAQSFEGVVTATSFGSGKARPMTIEVKGRRWRGQDERGQGMISDGNGSIIVDAEHHTYRRMPDLFGAMSAMAQRVTLVSTGKHDTVAGQDCQYYTPHAEGFPPDGSQMCITQAFGFVAIESGLNYCSAIASKMRSEFTKGCFLLKVVDRRGNPVYTVTGITRRPVSDAEFAPPAGYTEMKTQGMSADAGNN